MFLFAPIFYSPKSTFPPNFWRKLYLECVPRPTQTSVMLFPFTIWSSSKKNSKAFNVLFYFIEHPSLLAKHLFLSVDPYLFTFDSILTSTDDAFHHVTALKLRRCMFGL